MPLHAQEAASEVTDGDIEHYKTTARNACIESGVVSGAPQDQIMSFCGCVMDTLIAGMTREEWQQAYFYALKERGADEKAVLAPHLAKVDACRPKK